MTLQNYKVTNIIFWNEISKHAAIENVDENLDAKIMIWTPSRYNPWQHVIDISYKNQSWTFKKN